ncbi:MAG: hypothetical protein ACJ798_11730 [Phenylobacterium sp.]
MPRDRTIAIPQGGREAAWLTAAAGLLALSVLADSGIEHDRGGWRNPAMVAPLIASTSSIVASAAGLRGRSSDRWRTWVYAAATGVGVAGLGFHLFNLFKRPGRLNWLNLFYAAPIGAPAALSLAGLLGLLADAVRRGRSRISGFATARIAAALAALGLAGTIAEAGLLHFRGAFQNPFMWVPVTVPPVSAALMARAAIHSAPADPRPVTHAWLALTALIGLAGAGFHVFGIHRAMGGWRNWRQNLIDGPPIPAPPAFTALAIASLAALSLQAGEAGAAA